MEIAPLKKIMLVEDEEDIRAIAKISLEKIGQFTVEYATSGIDALEKLKTYHPDLILLDMMMPGMDGITTLAELRKLPEYKDTPVIFMTAKIQPTEVAQYRALGATDVFHKPFDPLSLPEKLKETWETLHAHK